MTDQDKDIEPDTGTRADVTRAMLADRLTQADLAREVELSASALSQWLKSAYKGDNAAIEAKLSAWLARRAERIAPVELPSAPHWVDTPTGRAIEKALTFARTRSKMALVYGGAGVGKTTALERYARNIPRVWYVRASPANASMAALLRELCEVMAIYITGWKNAALTSDVIWRLTGEPSLVIVDEAQYLSIPALEQLRYIHDESGAGLVLSGNESVYSRLTGGHRRAEFAQLFSRVGRRLRISMPKDGDVAAVLDAWRVTGSRERAYAAQIASLPGGLRGLVNLLEEASLAARGLGKPLDVGLLRMAWADLGGAA